MHPVLKSYLGQFVQENDYSSLSESEQFERFVNYCKIYQFYPDSFDIQEISTGENDRSIDGAAILIDNELVFTVEEAENLFNKVRTRQSVHVQYIFLQTKRSEGFDAGDILKFGQGVQSLLLHDGEETILDNVLAEISSIHNKVVENLNKVDNGRPNCILCYATTGIWNEDSGLRSQMQHIVDQIQKTSLFNEVVFDPLDREELIRLWNLTRKSVSASFSVQNILALPTINKVQESYLAIVLAKEFVTNVLTDDDGRVRNNVFEHNVRAYLGDDNPVNSKIRETILEESNHDRFIILNNGITIISPDIKSQGTRVSLSDFQIVNGCQTSHSLVRNQHALSNNVGLIVRLIEADDPDLLAQLVEATNSQTNVPPSQFLSIQPFARGIERYFASFEDEDTIDCKLFFERRTRQFTGQDISSNRVFDIEKMARVYAAMFLDNPHLACRYPKQILQELSSSLFQKDQRESAYFASALAHYRLSLALINNIDSRYRPYLWHILMIMKYQVLGNEIPPLNSKKIDKACERLIDPLKIGGKASLPPFNEAVKVIDSVGEATRDRLKRQTYTQEILRYLGIKKRQQV